MKFQVNQNTTIKKFDFIDDKIHEFMKFGYFQPYKEFKGFINKKKVTGFVCLNDDQIYGLKYLKKN